MPAPDGGNGVNDLDGRVVVVPPGSYAVRGPNGRTVAVPSGSYAEFDADGRGLRPQGALSPSWRFMPATRRAIDA